MSQLGISSYRVPIVPAGAFSLPRTDIPKEANPARTPSVAPQESSARQYGLPQYKNKPTTYWNDGKLPPPPTGLPLGRGSDGFGTVRIGKTEIDPPPGISATVVAGESATFNIDKVGSFTLRKNSFGGLVLTPSRGLNFKVDPSKVGVGGEIIVGKGQSLKIETSAFINGSDAQKSTFNLDIETINKNSGLSFKASFSGQNASAQVLVEF
jgi:hypothetical protein